MLEWIRGNIGTIIVLFIVAAVVAAVIIKMVRDRKQGKSSCGCNCAECALHGECHKSVKSK